MQFLEAENVPVLPWPAYSPELPPIEHDWDALRGDVQQRVPVPVNIQQLRTAIEQEWDNNPQFDQLYAKEMSHCMRQMVVTPDTDTPDTQPYFFVF
jgi:hypothetical protein